MTHRLPTTTDITLSNHRVFHNTHTEEGKLLTSSNHNYIVFRIPASPIEMPIKAKLSLPKADWNKHKKMIPQHERIISNMTDEEIDNNVER